MIKKTILTLGISLLFFSGCEDNVNSTETISYNTGPSSVITVVDPYVVGAVLCVDANKNTLCDSYELRSNPTDENGQTVFPEKVAPYSKIILAENGTHMGEPFDLEIFAYSDGNGDVGIITPLRSYEKYGLSNTQITDVLNYNADQVGYTNWSVDYTAAINDPMKGIDFTSTDLSNFENSDFYPLQANMVSASLMKIIDRLGYTNADLINSLNNASDPIHLVIQNLIRASVETFNKDNLITVQNSLSTLRDNNVNLTETNLPTPTLNTLLNSSFSVIDGFGEKAVNTMATSSGSISEKLSTANSGLEEHILNNGVLNQDNLTANLEVNYGLLNKDEISTIDQTTMDSLTELSNVKTGTTISGSYVAIGDNGEFTEPPNQFEDPSTEVGIGIEDGFYKELGEVRTDTLPIYGYASFSGIPIEGAQFCEDLNKNFSCDDGEILSSVSDANGRFSFSSQLTDKSFIITKQTTTVEEEVVDGATWDKYVYSNQSNGTFFGLTYTSLLAGFVSVLDVSNDLTFSLDPISYTTFKGLDWTQVQEIWDGVFGTNLTGLDQSNIQNRITWDLNDTYANNYTVIETNRATAELISYMLFRIINDATYFRDPQRDDFYFNSNNTSGMVRSLLDNLQPIAENCVSNSTNNSLVTAITSLRGTYLRYPGCENCSGSTDENCVCDTTSFTIDESNLPTPLMKDILSVWVAVAESFASAAKSTLNSVHETKNIGWAIYEANKTISSMKSDSLALNTNQKISFLKKLMKSRYPGTIDSWPSWLFEKNIETDPDTGETTVTYRHPSLTDFETIPNTSNSTGLLKFTSDGSITGY